MKLTLSQQDIFNDQRLNFDLPNYNIGAKIRIKGNLNVEILKSVYINLIDQHDAYRLIFSLNKKNNVFSKVISSHNTELEYLDFSDDVDSEIKACNFMQELFLKPFDLLSGSLLFKFLLIKVDTDIHYLFTVCHHIITDGWGTSLMFQRLVSTYNEQLNFGHLKSKYNFNYSEFVCDDEKYEKSDYFNIDKDYWNAKFINRPENLFEKIVHRRSDIKSKRVSFYIKREIYDRMAIFSKEINVSTFHFILGSFYLFISKKFQVNDFVIGLPVLNRNKSQFKKTVGLFMGISPLRIKIDFQKTFKDLLVTIKEQLRLDYRHQRFPIGKIINDFLAKHDSPRLYNVILSYEKHNYSENFIDTLCNIDPLSHNSELKALNVYIREFNEKDDIKIDFDYNLSYFNDSDMVIFLEQFESLLYNILENSNNQLNNLNFLLSKDLKTILYDFNNTFVPLDDKVSILDLISEHVIKFPHHVAVFDDFKAYSYSEMQGLVDQIAYYLKKNSNNKSPVGVFMERSPFLVFVLLGILKAGKIYVPLDPSLPLERLDYIINQSKIALIISDKYDFSFKEKSYSLKVINYEDILNFANYLMTDFLSDVKGTDSAYVIYTSGSTGNPKGVEVSHKSLLNFLLSMSKKFDFQSSDCLFSVTSSSFDISILEFLLPLISGGKIYVADKKSLSNPENIVILLNQIRPSYLQATPSFFQFLLNGGWVGDKSINLLCGGDTLNQNLANILLNFGNKVYNMYGPTETTIWSSMKLITSPLEALNIGSPIDNTQFYILDQYKNILPVGEKGNLYIGGIGLAKGYYNDIEITKEKFINNPYRKDSLIYDTGDIGRWNCNGEIEFYGRSDNQVKVRGFRVELGEIESKINLIHGVKQSIVCFDSSDSSLVAFLIMEDNFMKIDHITSTLKKSLPIYMIPNIIIFTDKFPLTPNFKIDRKALFDNFKSNNYINDEVKGDFTELQKIIGKCWIDVLNLSHPISLDDNFFYLGGNSINVINLVAALKLRLGINLDFNTIFSFPTIQLLSEFVEKSKFKNNHDLPVANKQDFYSVTFSQYEIWLASQRSNFSIAYNMFAAFKVEGNISTDLINLSINKLLKHNEILRTNFVEIDGQVFQKINPYDSSMFKLTVFKNHSINSLKLISTFISEEFDLVNDLLFKCLVIYAKNKECFLVFCSHHLILDGWSLNLLFNKFIFYYNEGNSISHNINLYKSEYFQFKDYSEWLKTIEITKDFSFWNNYLLEFKRKKVFLEKKSYSSDTNINEEIYFNFGLSNSKKLRILAKKNNLPIYCFLVSFVNIFIYKFSLTKDICLGVVNSGRSEPFLLDIVGLFSKTLILRTSIYDNFSFLQLVHSTQKNLLNIDLHKDFPKKINVQYFDVLLVYHDSDSFNHTYINLFDSKLYQINVNPVYSRFPLIFNFYDFSDEISMSISYNIELYDKDYILILGKKIEFVIKEILTNPNVLIDDIDISFDFEKRNILDFKLKF